ncbi:sericin-2 isoform X2 [Macrobrachium rosenbergii]
MGASDNASTLKTGGLEATTSHSSSSPSSSAPLPSSSSPSSDFPPRSSDESAPQGSSSSSTSLSSSSEEGSSTGLGSSLVCWSCSSSSHGNPCTNIDPTNSTTVDAKVCDPDEKFCSVRRIWYVVETKKGEETVVFSVNRNCSAECTPNCMVIGDRTKIHSCTSCCTESHCNTDNSSSSRQTSNFLLLMSALMVAIAPVLSILALPAAQAATSNQKSSFSSSKRHQPIPLPSAVATTSSDVFLFSSQKPGSFGSQDLTRIVREHQAQLDQSQSSTLHDTTTFQSLCLSSSRPPSSIPESFPVSASVSSSSSYSSSSKSFDNF